MRRTPRWADAGWILLLLGTPLNAAANETREGPRVTVAEGELQGRRSEGTDQFLAIPFAAPPMGTLRWQPPVAAASWPGVRRADRLPPACPQTTADSFDEDCLYLNVYRPARQSTHAALPVMLWIHGGIFRHGSSAEYDPSELARETQTLVVTINYRLGALGFLAHPWLSAESLDGVSGNYGFMDQVAALRWVHHNISAFGGDPARITLAGQSAGGFSVCGHLVSPASRGFFAGAIMQSVFCAADDLADKEVAGQTFAEEVGCGDDTNVMSCLRALPVSELLAANDDYPAGLVAGSSVLPREPRESVHDGDFSHVPILIGNVRDEIRIGVIPLYPLAPDSYPFLLATFVPSVAAALPEALAEYPASDFADPAYALSTATSDSSYGGCQIRREAAAFASYTRTFLYEFDDPRAPVPRSVTLPPGFELGSSHSSELSYLFAAGPLVQIDAPRRSRAQRRLSREMQRAWGAFVQRGDPSLRRGPRWPAYEPASDLVMRLEPGGIRATSDYSERHRCAFWDSLIP